MKYYRKDILKITYSKGHLVGSKENLCDFATSNIF